MEKINKHCIFVHHKTIKQINNMKYFYNRIHLLCAYRMMKNNWSAWTEDSYASQMCQLDDVDLSWVMGLTDRELLEMEEDCLIWYKKK